MPLIYSRQQSFSKVKLPKTIGVLGYGAIGKAFVEILLNQYPDANLVVLDKIDVFFPNERRFKIIIEERTRNNLNRTLEVMGLIEDDILVDLSTDIYFLELWTLCAQNGVNYLNSSLEEWEDGEEPNSYPQNEEEAYKCSIGYQRDLAMKSQYFKSGPTALFESGFNPGVISHCTKTALEDCAQYYLNVNQTDVDLELLKQYLLEKNHSKLAQVLGVHTIHCSETDNQILDVIPMDVKQKFYNTWSCRGFITEGLIPTQIAKGQHEDQEIFGMYTIRNGETLCAKTPSIFSLGKSWLPNQDIIGMMIPHGESYSMHHYLKDSETGYSPTHFYVYDYNPLAKQFIQNLPKDSNIKTLDPQVEIIHPMNYHSLKGWDKVGALLIMKNNRGWWKGSIMDEIDSSQLFNGKFGPTVLQVAAGVYGGFLWIIQNPNSGAHFSEDIDSDAFLSNIIQFLGRFISIPVDLNQTQLKDCNKIQHFICHLT